MRKDTFAVGIDYGTESGRAVVVRVNNGEIVGQSIVPYPDGVIDERLPGGRTKLEPDWALQNPRDYLFVVEKGVPKALKEGRVKAEKVIGIGTDFTASSPLPTLKDGTPLCFLPKYRQHPHAWVKLWKHHAAQPEANRINEIGRERVFEDLEDWLRLYFGLPLDTYVQPKLLVAEGASPEYRAG